MNAPFAANQLEKTLRVALYARFSDERQNPLSARDQLALCEDRAIQEGWRVVLKFTDDAISGSVRMRPASHHRRRNGRHTSGGA